MELFYYLYFIFVFLMLSCLFNVALRLSAEKDVFLALLYAVFSCVFVILDYRFRIFGFLFTLDPGQVISRQH